MGDSASLATAFSVASFGMDALPLPVRAEMSKTSTFRSMKLLTYRRVLSGDTSTPWGARPASRRITWMPEWA